MKAQGIQNNKQKPQQKTVQLYLQQANKKQSDLVNVKNQKHQKMKQSDLHQSEEKDQERQSLTQSVIVTSCGLLQQDQKTLEQHAPQYQLAIVNQQKEFLEHQVKELQDKLKQQENMYESILSVYQQQSNEEIEHKVRLLKLQDSTGQLSDQKLEVSFDTNDISRLKDRIKELEELKSDQETKLNSLEEECKQREQQFKFKIKDQKLQIQDLKMKLKHGENRIFQKEDFFQRLIEDAHNKYQGEIERIKQKGQNEQDDLSVKYQDQMRSIKDIYDIENLNLKGKINELKAQLKSYELQIGDYQNQIKDKMSINFEAFEHIHIRYLEEIRNLNMNLSQFRSEKETEIKKLQEKSQQLDEQLKKNENQNSDLQCKLTNEKKVYESRIADMRRKVDQAFKQLIDHEKCEITIQAQRQRIQELKVYVAQLEQKEKWNWKNMVHKRGQIEQEKQELRRKMNNQSKLERNKVMSQSRQNEDLEKRVFILNHELETSQTQKHKLKSKLNELEKEVLTLKKDNINNINTSMSMNDRSYVTRSVSPGQGSIFKNSRGEKGNSQINKSQSNNFGRMLQKLGSGRYQSGLSPINQDTNISNVNASNIQPSQNCSFIPSPQNNTSQLKEFFKDKTGKQQKLGLKKLSTAPLQENILVKVQESEESFLISPRLDSSSFLHSSILNHIGSSNLLEQNSLQKKKSGNFNILSQSQLQTAQSQIGYNQSELNKVVNQSSKQNRPKANSQYDVRCKNCLKWFDSVERFLMHQLKCNQHQQSFLLIEEKESEMVVTETNMNESPPLLMKRGQSESKFKGITIKQSNNKKTDLKRQGSQSKLLKNNNSSTIKDLSTPLRNNVNSSKMIDNQVKQSRNEKLIKKDSSKELNRYQSNIQQHESLKVPQLQMQHLQIEMPQIIMSTSPCNINNDNILLSQEKSQDKMILTERSGTFESRSSAQPNSTQKNAKQNQSIFTQSLQMAQSFLNNKEGDEKLEKENERIMFELKQAKMDFALCQERSASNEMCLKKEILNLQMQLNAILQGQGTMMRQGSQNSFIQNISANIPPSQSQVSSQQHNVFTPFNGANINISTTNVTCFNIVKNEQDDNCNGSPKNSSKPHPTPNNLNKQEQSLSEQENHQFCVDSPLKTTEFREEDTGDYSTCRDRNQSVRVTKVPNLLIRK